MMNNYELPIYTKMGRTIEEIRELLNRIRQSRIEIPKKPVVMKRRSKGLFCGTMLLPSELAMRTEAILHAYGYEDIADFLLTIQPKHQHTVDCYVPFYIKHEDVYKTILKRIANGDDDLCEVKPLIECKLCEGFTDTFVHQRAKEGTRDVITRRKVLFAPRKDKLLDIDEVTWLQAVKRFNEVDKYEELGIDNYANEMYQRELATMEDDETNGHQLTGFNKERMKQILRKQNKRR
ncbi:hypothetical protein [Staphylococcus cohnii]|uniref:hypothetical protein n=1 Tax=Staphylococcus cohnii TaxID=29382 RepID=UPI003D7EC75B